MSELNFTCEAGALVRGRVKREITRYCWENDIDLYMRESKGFFQSVMRFDLKGTDEQIMAAKRDLQRWLNRVRLNS